MSGYGNEPPRGLPPRPRVDYNDRDSHPYGGPRGGERYRDRDHYNDRDDYRGGGGARGRTWEDEERYTKRGRYEDDYSRPPPPSRDDYYSAPPFHPQQQPPPPAEYQQHPYSQYSSPTGSPAATPAPVGRKPPVRPEPPSASVVLLGIPAHVGDAQLRYFLEDMGASVDSTTVIIDRTTGLSKCYGFAKFSSVEHARAFVEPNFPSIPWKERGVPGEHDGSRIKINYSQKSGGWREDQGATARLTDDQRRTTEGGTSQGFHFNDGTRDVGSTPSQILLLRGLDTLTNEEEIVAALARVGGRASGAVSRGGVKKIYIVRDRGSKQSWGFAFVQFSDVKLATDVLASAFNAALHPSGFRIRNRILALSFKHENSFIPIYAKSDWSFKGEGGQQLAYWDDKGYVQPWLAPAPTQEELDRIPKGPKADEDAKIDKDMLAFLGELEDESTETSNALIAPGSNAVAAAAPPAALPAPGSIAPISIKPLSTASKPTTAVPSRPTKEIPAAGIVPAAPSAAIGGKEKKGDLIISRKAAGNIAKWNTKQKELKAVPDEASTSTPAASKATSTSTTATLSIATQAPTSEPPPTSTPTTAPSFDDPEFEHADPISMICLLCQRQFKKIEELRKHNKLSALHKAHLLSCIYYEPSTNAFFDPHSSSPLAHFRSAPVSACANRKTAARKKHAAASSAEPSPSAVEQPKYVDRAAVRRSTYNQSDHPEPPSKRKKFEAPEAPAPPPEAPNKDGLEETNAGMKMLEKMGWSKGAGLGASGAGRIDPVQAAQFAQGAGLGSTKGVAVGSEDAKKGYAEKLRDRARERLNEA
ncbi:uncharacterized protein JCM6883_004044 [Sporobolomyces salmoneus]|uniref:uncharacterized protein n=1 Tax=Sporobolomyces salmoneus TaxID=183962 RepID=UPI00317A91CC